MEEKIRKVLDILVDNAKAMPKEIATMVGAAEDEVVKIIEKLEKDKLVLKYKAVVNSDKLNNGEVESFIEVKVTPQRDKGFDSIAERIYKFPEVKALWLMSGNYDFMALVKGKNLKDVAAFVSEKLSTIEGVRSTATHFLLKRYKEDGVAFYDQEAAERLKISP